jgi:uncharacterized protein YacL
LIRILKVSFSAALALLGGYAFYALGNVYVEWIVTKEDLKRYAGFNKDLMVPLFAALGVLLGFLWAYHTFSKLTQFGDTLEKMPPRDKVATITGVFLGFLATGLVALIVLNSVQDKAIGVALILALGYVLCYMCVSAMMSMRRELFSILPGNVEILEDQDGSKPKILDTSVIIDGRIADIARTGFLEGTMYVPGFVLDELQHIADSSDGLRRARGRRGLDVLNQMRKEMQLVVRSFDLPAADKGDEVDLKLVKLAKQLNGAILTTDFNLNKVAQLRGVEVLNINELTNALKPVVLPGEVMNVFILKEGKEHNQGVAYLDDGTMVVVDNARARIGRNLDIVVTSVLQTTAGRMIFGKHTAETPQAAGEVASRSERAERDDTGRRPRPAAQA